MVLRSLQVLLALLMLARRGAALHEDPYDEYQLPEPYWFCQYMPQFCRPPINPLFASEHPTATPTVSLEPSAAPITQPPAVWEAPPSILHVPDNNNDNDNEDDLDNLSCSHDNNSNNLPKNNSKLYDIRLLFADNVPVEHRDAFQEAARQWKRVIRGDVTDTPLLWGTSRCGRWPLKVDDIVICIAYSDERDVDPDSNSAAANSEMLSLDGTGGTLAFARPILHRATGPDAPLAVTGEIVVDRVDAGGPYFAETIFHEMAHVFGLGTLWTEKQLQTSTTVPCPYATRSRASHEWQCLSGCTNQAVPIEQTSGNPGSDCGHWDEFCLQHELLTPEFGSSERTPLSRITIASLHDLGHVVDYNAADIYTVDDIHPSCRCSSDDGLDQTKNNIFEDGDEDSYEYNYSNGRRRRRLGEPPTYLFGNHPQKAQQRQSRRRTAAQTVARDRATDLGQRHLLVQKHYQSSSSSTTIPHGGPGLKHIGDRVVGVAYLDPKTQRPATIVVRTGEL